METYREAFTVNVGDRKVVEVLEEGQNRIKIAVTAIWSNPVTRVAFDILVPTPNPVRFSWDEGLFGYELMPPRGTPRFCHPRLRSRLGEQIGLEGNLPMLMSIRDLEFYWESWFDRIHDELIGALNELANSQRTVTVPFYRSRIQRVLTQLMNGAPGKEGLQLTSVIKTLRFMAEVQVGYPDVPGNNELYEALKLRYLEFLDEMCDILHTGKNDVGRYVMRVRPNAPISLVTGKPMPDFAMAINPLSHVANPTRSYRENRGIVDALRIENPVDPPLRMKGVKTPAEILTRLTRVTIAIADIPDRNVFIADEDTTEEYSVKSEERISLDAILVTPSGRKALSAFQTRSDALTAEEYLPRREELMEKPGFREEEFVQVVEVMADGTAVYQKTYQYWYDIPSKPRYDKIKLACGGLKGVSRPIPQLWAQMGTQMVPIDIVISESALLSKGALYDAALYPLLSLAGITEVDPTWTVEEMVRLAEEGLKERSLPVDGRFTIFAKKKRYFQRNGQEAHNGSEIENLFEVKLHSEIEMVEIGTAIAGPIPAMRAQETEGRQSNSAHGVRVDAHTRNLSNIPFPYDPELEKEVADVSRFFFDYNRVLK